MYSNRWFLLIIAHKGNLLCIIPNYSLSICPASQTTARRHAASWAMHGSAAPQQGTQQDHCGGSPFRGPCSRTKSSVSSPRECLPKDGSCREHRRSGSQIRAGASGWPTCRGAKLHIMRVHWGINFAKRIWHKLMVPVWGRPLMHRQKNTWCGQQQNCPREGHGVLSWLANAFLTWSRCILAYSSSLGPIY